MRPSDAPFEAQEAHPQPDKRPACRVTLFFQEQIKGPKNAPIARFFGLGCYQTRSKRGARKRCGKTPAKRLALKLAVFWPPRRRAQISYRIRAVKAGQRPNRRLAVGAKARAGEGRGRRVRSLPLFFQERTKGPKNASIARFFGLGCYQTRSERGARKRCGKTPAKRLALKLAVFWPPRRRAQISYRIRAVKAGQRPNRRLAVGAKARAGEGRGRRVRSLPLFFQERTKGPENAPITRFFGLGCYQTRSETGRPDERARCRRPARQIQPRPLAAGPSGSHCRRSPWRST